MSLVNMLPNVTIPTCTYCGVHGHNVRRCIEAYQTGLSIHSDIMFTIGEHLIAPDLLANAVGIFINSLDFTKLKLLSFVHRDIHIFASQLYNNFQIPLSLRALNTKRSLVVVLQFYYKNIYTQLVNGMNVHLPSQNRKFDISVDICKKINEVENETHFQCPICLDELLYENKVTLNCHHDVCNHCFDNYLSSLLSHQKNPCCSLCREKTTTIIVHRDDYGDKIKDKYIK